LSSSPKEFNGLLITLTGPTASGKSSIAKRLSDHLDNISLSVSTTTRQPRKGEVDGREYFYVDDQEFEKRVNEGQFLEHANYGKNRYGTELKNISLAEEKANDLVFDIEVQGVEQLKSLYPKQTRCIFVFPVSFEEIEKRLRRRGSESEEQISRRLEIARKEVEVLESEGFSDHKVINDSLDRAVEEVVQIIKYERESLKD
jgi:guanylate kinase